jgi:hypothetical protein
MATAPYWRWRRWAAERLDSAALLFQLAANETRRRYVLLSPIYSVMEIYCVTIAFHFGDSARLTVFRHGVLLRLSMQCCCFNLTPCLCLYILLGHLIIEWNWGAFWNFGRIDCAKFSCLLFFTRMKKFVALLSSVWQKDDSKLDIDDRALCKSSKLSYALLANLLFFSFITENQVTRRDAKELYHRTWAQFASPSHVEICHSSVPLSGIMTVCVVGVALKVSRRFSGAIYAYRQQRLMIEAKIPYFTTCGAPRVVKGKLIHS